jgi:putative SOS response-associated peptidase YedK
VPTPANHGKLEVCVVASPSSARQLAWLDSSTQPSPRASRWTHNPAGTWDPSGNKLFNARAETVAEKPSFRSAFAKRPCVIPVDGFYEWDHRPGRNRQPNFFTRTNDDPLLLAGLYERWYNPDDEGVEPLATCTIITTTSSVDMDEIHDRMPVVLSSEDVETWLNVADAGPDERLQLLRPTMAWELPLAQ